MRGANDSTPLFHEVREILAQRQMDISEAMNMMQMGYQYWQLPQKLQSALAIQWMQGKMRQQEGGGGGLGSLLGKVIGAAGGFFVGGPQGAAAGAQAGGAVGDAFSGGFSYG